MTDNSENAQLPSKDVVKDWVRDCSLLIESGVATSYIEVCPIRLHGLLAELQQLRARYSDETLYDGWKPMETANPSQLFASSTWVLLHTDAGMVTEATPYYFDGSGYIWMTARGENVRGSDDEKSRMLRVKPLHWRPLPKPPAQKASEPLPPCECLIIDKEPSAYHGLKCPRYVAGKL